VFRKRPVSIVSASFFADVFPSLNKQVCRSSLQSGRNVHWQCHMLPPGDSWWVCWRNRQKDGQTSDRHIMLSARCCQCNKDTAQKGIQSTEPNTGNTGLVPSESSNWRVQETMMHPSCMLTDLDGAILQWVERWTCDHGFKSYPRQELRNNLGQDVHTYVALSESSITWYWPRGSDAMQLGR